MIVFVLLNVFLVVVAVPSLVLWNPCERSIACWAKWLSGLLLGHCLISLLRLLLGLRLIGALRNWLQYYEV